MRQLFRVCLLCVMMGQVFAQSHDECSSKHADHKKSTMEVSEHLKHKIEVQVAKAFPQQHVDKIVKSPVTGLYEVMAGSMVFYASEDARYLVMGDILDPSRDPDDRSLTEHARSATRVDLFKSLKGHALVSYKPEHVKAVLTIFMDPDCGYCRKMHAEVPALMELGIEVRYLAFPRAGVGSPTYQKLVSVACAKDPKAAMDKIMNDESVPPGTCKNRVEEEYLVGQKLGVNGTPSLIFSDGTLSVGYRPAKDLAELALKHHNK